MIWKEQREIVPKVWLLFHLSDDFVDVLVKVIPEGEDANCPSLRPKSKVATIRRELHFSNVENGMDLSRLSSRAYLVYQDRCAAQVSLISAQLTRITEISPASLQLVRRGIWWHLDNNIEA